MTTIRASFSILGDNFSPARFQRLSRVRLIESHEPGAIARNGRFRGEPVAHGSATIEISDKPERWERFDELLGVIGGCIVELREAGAEEFLLECSVYHDGSCNFSFSVERLQRMAALKAIVYISCYEDPEEMERSEPFSAPDGET